MGEQRSGLSLLKGQLISYTMPAAGNESMNGSRILQLLQSGCPHISCFPQNQVHPPMESQLLKKNLFHSSLKIQLGGPVFCAFVLFSVQALFFSFIGPSILLIRPVLHQSGFKQARDSWVLGLVGSWQLMLS